MDYRSVMAMAGPQRQILPIRWHASDRQSTTERGDVLHQNSLFGQEFWSPLFLKAGSLCWKEFLQSRVASGGAPSHVAWPHGAMFALGTIRVVRKMRGQVG